MNIPRAVLVAVLALSLAACAQEAPPVEVAEPAPIETPVETPTPTPTPEPTQPAIGEITISTEGFGYLVPGQPVADVDPAIALVVFDEEACKGLGGYERDFARWVPNYPEGDEAFYIYTHSGKRDGEILRIVIRTPNITTAESVGVGSSREELLASYPDARIVPKNGFEIIAVDGTAGKILFEIQDDADGSDAVDFVTIVSTDDEDRGIARSGAGATCGS